MTDDASHSTDGDRPSRKGPQMDRLPPPAFPPGTRRGPVAWQHRKAKATGGGEEGQGEGFPEGAFISPDEPIRRIGEGFPEDALISPDDPLRPGRPKGPPPAPEETDPEPEESDPEEPDEVVVTGIGSNEPELSSYTAGRMGPYEPEEVARILEELAEGLRERGAGALLSEQETSPFESTLKGLIAGYLVGKGAYGG